MKNRNRIAIIFALIAASFALLVACQDKEPTRYTVYFDSLGGSSVASYSLAEGEAVNKPANPTRDMYVFDNWYTDADCTQAFSFGSGMPANDFTLYAGWTPEVWVSVTYDANGGEFADGDVQISDTCKIGSAFTATDNVPTRVGYSFGGWYTDKNGVDEFVSGSYPVENLTLYAGWNRTSDYAYVSYYGNGKLLEVLPIKKGETVVPYEFDSEVYGSDIVVSDYYTDAAMTAQYAFGAAGTDLNLYVTYYTNGLAFNGNKVTAYNGTSSIVYVPSVYNGTAITVIGNNAFYRSSEYAEVFGRITRVVLPDTIAILEDGAFRDCRYLSSVNLTSALKSVGADAFWNNERLNDFGVISGVSSIGNGAFTGCALIRNVELSQSLTSLGANAFADCTELREISIPGGIAHIGEYTFYGCKNLTAVTIDADNLSSIGAYAFKNCASLKSVVIRSVTPATFDYVREGTSRYSPFWGCASTLEISVPTNIVNSYKSIYAELDNGSLANKFTSIR